jgi:hypothetical protein
MQIGTSFVADFARAASSVTKSDLTECSDQSTITCFLDCSADFLSVVRTAGDLPVPPRRKSCLLKQFGYPSRYVTIFPRIRNED